MALELPFFSMSSLIISKLLMLFDFQYTLWLLYSVFDNAQRLGVNDQKCEF